MTERQKINLNEVLFSMEVEGFDIPDKEKQTLIGVLDGKFTFSEVLNSYISEGESYGRV